MKNFSNARFWTIVSIVILAIVAACGPSAREKTIATTFAAANAASDHFVAFDAKHQQEIVDHATDLASGKAALEAYRAKRAHVIDAFAAVYHLIAAAAIENKGATDITNMISAAAQLKVALDDLEGAKP